MCCIILCGVLYLSKRLNLYGIAIYWCRHQKLKETLNSYEYVWPSGHLQRARTLQTDTVHEEAPILDGLDGNVQGCPFWVCSFSCVSVPVCLSCRLPHGQTSEDIQALAPMYASVCVHMHVCWFLICVYVCVHAKVNNAPRNPQKTNVTWIYAHVWKAYLP